MWATTSSSKVGPPPPLLPFLSIRAPLSPDDVDTYVTTSSSEPDTPAGSDSDSGSDRHAPARVILRFGSMPVAKLTRDEDDDDVASLKSEEEDPLFSLVARVPSVDDVSPKPDEEQVLLEEPNQIYEIAEIDDYGDDLKIMEDSVDYPDLRFEHEYVVETIIDCEFNKILADVELVSDECNSGLATENSDGTLIKVAEFSASDSESVDPNETKDEEDSSSSCDELISRLDILSSSETAEQCKEYSSGSRNSSHNEGMELVEPIAQPQSRNISTFSKYVVTTDSAKTMSEEDMKFCEQIELIRNKFLAVVSRLGYSPYDPVPAKMLYEINHIEEIRLGDVNADKSFCYESARKGETDFSCNIVVIGKDGVGKSATINSIFGEEKSPTDPFKPKTNSVKEIVGTVNGIKIRVLDTPGLKSSVMDQAWNKRILSSVKKCMKRCPPDAIIYVDRIDTRNERFNDLAFLRTVNSVLGSSIWSKTIITLTHAASDDADDSQLSYNRYVDQKASLVNKAIHEAVGIKSMIPVALVENHSTCLRNGRGEKVLPNGCRWIQHLLLLCYVSKISCEANSLLKLEESPLVNILRSFPLARTSLVSERFHIVLIGLVAMAASFARSLRSQR